MICNVTVGSIGAQQSCQPPCVFHRECFVIFTVNEQQTGKSEMLKAKG